jgi:hypothetical protein
MGCVRCVGLVTNRHATMMIPFCIKKKNGSSHKVHAKVYPRTGGND